MARKKTENTDMPTTVPVTAAPEKPVRLILPSDLHRLLRLVAADDGVSMASYARDVIEDRIREEAQKRGIK